MTIKRYDAYDIDDAIPPFDVGPYWAGMLVMHADHAEIVRALEARIARLEGPRGEGLMDEKTKERFDALMASRAHAKRLEAHLATLETERANTSLWLYGLARLVGGSAGTEMEAHADRLAATLEEDATDGTSMVISLLRQNWTIESLGGGYVLVPPLTGMLESGGAPLSLKDDYDR